MTPQQEIEATLERLRNIPVVVERLNDVEDIGDEISALIRKAAEPFWYEDGTGVTDRDCRICHEPIAGHAPDCALLALCRAINGGTKP